VSTPDIRDLRIGMIGAGRHAQANLYPSLAALGVPVTSVATRSTATASAAARRHGADHAHADYRMMLAQDRLDGVIISLDPDDQATVTEHCLAAGVDVLVEKPLGLDPETAQRTADAAARHDRIAMVAFMKRFAPCYVRVRDLIGDPVEFGAVQSFEMSFAFASWTNELRNDTFLKLAAIHMVDLLRHLLGEVATVQGVANSTGADINLAFAVRQASGVVGTVNLVALPAWERGHEHLTVSGHHGYVVADNQTSVRYHRHQPGGPDGSGGPGGPVRWQALDEHTTVTESVVSTGSGGLQDLYRRGFVGEVEQFLYSVVTRQQPSCSAADNVATMVLCEQLLAALR
jgi:predicted dehydrogenase